MRETYADRLAGVVPRCGFMTRAVPSLVLVGLVMALLVACGDEVAPTAEDVPATSEPARDALGAGLVICEPDRDAAPGESPASELTSWDVETGLSTGYVDLSYAGSIPESVTPSYVGYLGDVSLSTCGRSDLESYPVETAGMTALLGSTLDVERNLLAAITTDYERPSAGVVDLRTGEFRDLSGLPEVDEDQFSTSDIRDHPPTFDAVTGDLVWLRETGTGTGVDFTVMRASTEGTDFGVEIEVEVAVNDFSRFTGNLFADNDTYADQPILRQPGGDIVLCCAIDYWDEGLPLSFYSACEIVDGVIDWREEVSYGYLSPNCDAFLGGGDDGQDIGALGWLPDGTLVDRNLNRWSYSPGAEGEVNVSLVGSLLPDTSRYNVQGVAVSPSGESVLLIADGEFWIVAVEGGEPRRLGDIPVGRVVAWTEPSS